MRELLTQYVDEQTPEEAPPFEYVERAARGRKTRNRVTAALVTAIVVASGATLAVVNQPGAEPAQPAAPVTERTIVMKVNPNTGEEITPGQLDDGPPPDRFDFGDSAMVLAGEARIISIWADPEQPSSLTVEVPQDATASYYCQPNMVVRILHQDDRSVRLAAYRYRLESAQGDYKKCNPLIQSSGGNQIVEVDLRRPLGLRTVYAGAAGKRILQH